jgi:hypothetical protein
MTALSEEAIPIPRTARPLVAIDTQVNPQACIDMLSILYHAERAALEAFERLSDPSVVEHCEIFIQACPMLIADEQAHLEDMEVIIRAIGGKNIQPPPPGFAELWDLNYVRRRMFFPLNARVAALFTLVTESLGYAYLYHLADATSITNEKVSSLLRSNVRDEQQHILISMAVLRRTLAKASIPAALDLALHFWVFLLLSRRAAKTMLKTLARVGFDPYVLAGSSLDFTCGLLRRIAEEKVGRSSGLRLLGALAPFAFSPAMMRLFEALCSLPEPPFIWLTIRGLSRMMRRFSVDLALS